MRSRPPPTFPGSLADEAWKIFHSMKGFEPLVRFSLPILYFGDFPRYRHSPLRVVTVGLNPSKQEFPSTDPYLRFPWMQQPMSQSQYANVLDTYFARNPYRDWFDPSYEDLFKGLGVSFYADMAESVALHTDLCSPLATDPTWSRLSDQAKASLVGPGVKLWHRLVAALQPHLVLASVGRKWLQQIRFRIRGPTSTPIPTIEVSNRELSPGVEARFVVGGAMRRPFGSLESPSKLDLGRRLRRDAQT